MPSSTRSSRTSAQRSRISASQMPIAPRRCSSCSACAAQSSGTDEADAMRIEISPGLRLYVDVEGLKHVPDGAALREPPTLILLHGGPGFEPSSYQPRFSELADVAQIVYVDHRGHGRSDRCGPEQWTLDV